MLIDSAVEAAVPADQLNRARDFYADKLGLTPVSEFAEMQLSDRAAPSPATQSSSPGGPGPFAAVRNRMSSAWSGS